MVLDSGKTHKNLKKKGFIDAPGDHKFLHYYHEGRFVLSTKISHGSAHDLDDFLIKKMAIQCKLNKEDFVNLANCPMSKEEYINRLIESGLIILLR